MRKLVQTMLIFAVAAIAATGCRSTCGNGNNNIDAATKQWTKETEVLLRQAGEQLGVPLQTQPMVHYAQWGASFYTAPAANLDQVNPADFGRGVNLGVAYVDSPGQSYPKGYYNLRAIGDARDSGKSDAQIQLIDTSGQVAATVPATIEVPQAAAARSFPPDVTVQGFPVNGRPNRIHITTYTTARWAVSTPALVIPPPDVVN